MTFTSLITAAFTPLNHYNPHIQVVLNWKPNNPHVSKREHADGAEGTGLCAQLLPAGGPSSHTALLQQSQVHEEVQESQKMYPL